MSQNTFTLVLEEQGPAVLPRRVPVTCLVEQGKLWIRPAGYGNKTSASGCGYPISLELWQGRLRLIVFNAICDEDPLILDMENALESALVQDERGPSERAHDESR
ncbi:MAG TPA: hypothetical protein PKB02_14675 [Anaerohalosphaeraceae bacterium]|nr:hypothetical protein [Anaerohalosphaeraceae bacterium]